MGGLRAAGQLIAYELPHGARRRRRGHPGRHAEPATASSTAQADGAIFGFDGLGNPFILTQFVGFFIFLAAVQAELTQPPFDMPVAESELVGGYQVEYSGFRFLLFFLAEFATAFAFAGIAAILFLGGWGVPGHRHRQRRLLARRPGRPVRQDHARVVPHLLGPLHLPPLP